MEIEVEVEVEVIDLGDAFVATQQNLPFDLMDPTILGTKSDSTP
jgi:hypothetical protein